MPLGPGKYGARAEAILRDIDASCVVGDGYGVCETCGGADNGQEKTA